MSRFLAINFKRKINKEQVPVPSNPAHVPRAGNRRPTQLLPASFKEPGLKRKGRRGAIRTHLSSRTARKNIYVPRSAQGDCERHSWHPTAPRAPARRVRIASHAALGKARSACSSARAPWGAPARALPRAGFQHGEFQRGLSGQAGSLDRCRLSSLKLTSCKPRCRMTAEKAGTGGWWPEPHKSSARTPARPRNRENPKSPQNKAGAGGVKGLFLLHLKSGFGTQFP